MSIPNTTSLSQVRGSSPLQYRPETNRFERLCPLSSGCGEVRPGHGTSPSNVTIAVTLRPRESDSNGLPCLRFLNHVPLMITVLGDGPVLEWLQSSGFPPWSLAFIPSQRKGGETRWSLNPTNGQHEETQSWVLTEGIARVLALRKTCARIHWWEGVVPEKCL